MITLTKYLDPVVRMPVSSNPGNLGFFIFLSKALSRIIFFFLFRVSNHQIVGKENWIEMNLLFKASYLSSNFALTVGYLNPALKNPAQMFSWCPPVSYAGILHYMYCEKCWSLYIMFKTFDVLDSGYRLLLFHKESQSLDIKMGWWYPAFSHAWRQVLYSILHFLLPLFLIQKNKKH